MNRPKKFLLIVVVVTLVAGIVLTAVRVYCAGQLRSLKGQALYESPEEGMRALVAIVDQRRQATSYDTVSVAQSFVQISSARRQSQHCH